MEGIGSEVSQKIRAAIKAKLIELGAYVDDELPDYIMVMVANKRTRSQMDEDLQLFLASNTKVFTSWLHTVLQKLQEVTVACFENKKDVEGRKSLKKKKSGTDSEMKDRKHVEETEGKEKKHSKKHKEGKKPKKSKHKSQEKVKSKYKKKEKEETKKSDKEGNEISTSLMADKNADQCTYDKQPKNKSMQLNEVVGKAILVNLKSEEKERHDKNYSSNVSTSCSISSSKEDTNKKENVLENKGNENFYRNDNNVNTTPAKDHKGSAITTSMNKKPLNEDDFNIEPLKPTEKITESISNDDYKKNDASEVPIAQAEKTISAPTEELLKEHNKLLNEEQKGEEKEERKSISVSEDSVSPEEMRKQLLLSRAKRKLEHGKLADRMRSNSPDVLILEESTKIMGKDQSSRSSPPPSPVRNKNSSKFLSGRHSTPSPHRKSHSPRKSPDKKYIDTKLKVSNKTAAHDEKRAGSLIRAKDSFTTRDKDSARILDTRRNIKTEGLKADKNLGVKTEKEVSSKKRSVSSRVVTITGPEAPEISSIIKVKPREYLSKDKQANKTLILKAVADAEKSVAITHVRTELEPEPKKEAIFTKHLRGKRYEKLAVTLSNIRKSPSGRGRPSERISGGSDKSDRTRNKLDSSEVSEGVRGKSDLLSRKLSKSEDQFISSKTTIMEKNDKYIRCWLEGVEKAVKDDEMVNPNEMEDNIIHSTLSDEENELTEGVRKKVELKRKRVNELISEKNENEKLSDKEIAKLRLLPSSRSRENGPQIVVTLDGLDSKVIKDIILRNKGTTNGPLLSGKYTDREGEMKETNAKSSSEKAPNESRKLGFERISDRFGRLNKSIGCAMEKEKSEKKSSVRSDEKLSTESKNKQLIAQLSEKFGKVDREFENKKRKYPEEEERRCSYNSRKHEVEDGDRSEKYKKSVKSNKELLSTSPSSKFASSSSSQVCKFYPKCKNVDCRYIHPKKCRYDDDCTNTDCKYVHSKSSKKKFKWYSKS